MAVRLMKAVQYTGYGGGAAALQHVEIPIPTPKEDELLIKLEAVSLNPWDTRSQEGKFRPLYPSRFPCIPGTDIAGEIVEVGPNVKNLQAGDKIVSFLSMDNGGGLSEYAIAPANFTVKRPEEVSAEEGACLPQAALTALQAVRDHAGIQLNEGGKQTNLLLTAASGGVGHYAVQIAKLGGAHVTATCGTRNINLVMDLGADEVLDYKTPEGAALKSPSGLKYDVVINCAKNTPWSTFQTNLSSSAKVIELTPNLKSLARYVAQKVTLAKNQLLPIMVSRSLEDLSLVVNLAAEGKLRTHIDSKYPIEKVEDAWIKMSEGHATGKIVVTFGN
uniref:Enoyl reductase (ER) domain-containing protein n=1 Tax=Araucaria cunninghamii TaxID=56994 RepID=A0A0D6R2X6_ARACU